jgi:hypothetical protein
MAIVGKFKVTQTSVFVHNGLPFSGLSTSESQGVTQASAAHVPYPSWEIGKIQSVPGSLSSSSS